MLPPFLEQVEAVEHYTEEEFKLNDKIKSFFVASNN